MTIMTEGVAGYLCRRMQGERDYPFKIHTGDEVLEASGRARQARRERILLSSIAGGVFAAVVAGFTAIQEPEDNFNAACSLHENGEAIAFSLETDEPLRAYFTRYSEQILNEETPPEDTAAIIAGHCTYFVWNGFWLDKQRSDAFPSSVAGDYLNPENNIPDFLP